MSLLDTISQSITTDPARWPDKRGDFHADCPYCGKPAKKGQVHFRISPDGLCYCQVCQAGTSLSALADHLGIKAERNGSIPQVVYPYYSADGVLLYEVVRYYKGKEKSFFQRHPNADGDMVNGMNGVERVLYRLPELVSRPNGTPVYIVEGEKDVEMLRMRGLVATTNVGGAGKWQAAYSAALKDADVIILPDNDQVGEQHAQAVYQSLQGVAHSVKIVRLPSLLDKGDISDWIVAGHTLVELAALCVDPPKSAEQDTHWLQQGVTLAELQHKPFDPETWVVEDILPEGACLLAAKYKSKKSWLALAIGLPIALGGKALGRLPVAQGRVLYLDLEGKQQRIKKRTRAILGVQNRPWPANFHVYTTWPQGNDGMDRLEQWFRIYPDTRLVVIDVLSDFRRPMDKYEQPYQYDRATVTPLNQLFERYHAAGLLVHHFNKAKNDDIMDGISGTTGLPSAVNTMWGMARDVNNSAITILNLRGRDLERDDPIALKWDSYLNIHVIEGPAIEVSRSGEQRAVLTALSDTEPRTPQEIATALGKPVESIKFLLRKLLNDGLVDKPSYGKYIRIVATSAHGATLTHDATAAHSSLMGDPKSERVSGDLDTAHSSAHSSTTASQSNEMGQVYIQNSKSEQRKWDVREGEDTDDLFDDDELSKILGKAGS